MYITRSVCIIQRDNNDASSTGSVYARHGFCLLGAHDGLGTDDVIWEDGVFSL